MVKFSVKYFLKMGFQKVNILDTMRIAVLVLKGFGKISLERNFYIMKMVKFKDKEVGRMEDKMVNGLGIIQMAKLNIKQITRMVI